MSAFIILAGIAAAFCALVWFMAYTDAGNKIDNELFPHGDDGWDDNTMP